LLTNKPASTPSGTEGAAPVETVTASNGTAPAAPSNGPIAGTTAAGTDGSEFLAKLARAMHTTAARERTTLAEAAEQRRQLHVQAIRERAAREAERIRQLAAEDMKAIETWSGGEANRIKVEREQRVAALNEDLELSLKEHGTKIEEEVTAAESALTAYRTAVEAFFAGLDHETDPMVIARQAASYPAFPKLAETEATFYRAADPAPAMVGVMSPSPAGGSLEAATAAIVGSQTLIGESASDPSPASEPSVSAVEAPVPVGAYVGPSGSSAGHEVSALRAMLAARSDGRPGPEANGSDRDSQG
jgi:hypothetical protein